jgi:hypothetical protein
MLRNVLIHIMKTGTISEMAGCSGFFEYYNIHFLTLLNKNSDVDAACCPHYT